ncbi:MAG: hypothetical protein HC768_18615 [Acaryochloris sp. CRU_2_0]|nr:hypothetical protein [Acaryochloris sp. CRU_2_0]
MQQLKEENQQLKDRESTYQREIGDKNLTADITRFKGQTQQTPGKSMVNPAQLRAERPPVPTRPPVRTQNTVRIPRRWSNVSPPYSLMARRPVARPPIRSFPSPPSIRSAQSQKPSLDSCIGYFERNVSVPGCASYRISKNTTAAQPIVKSPSTPAVRPRPIAKNPLKLAFNPTTKPTAKRKPDYQVNYAAGEIQTVDQFEQEFYGSGQTSAPQLSRMTAKVVDRVEWLTPEDAQKVIIPLIITSGPQKGQTAEAKITQINGLQFTAHVVNLNGQEIESGKLELRNKNTKYLRADLKRQGGESLGTKF